MDVTPLVRQGTQIIQSYAGGQFRVSGTIYQNPVIVMPDQVLPWEVKDFPSLSAEGFAPLIERASELDVVLLGTGAQMMLFKPTFRHSLKKEGLSVDAMDTGAACRTYNVLMAEGRRVAAALLPV